MGKASGKFRHSKVGRLLRAGWKSLVGKTGDRKMELLEKCEDLLAQLEEANEHLVHIDVQLNGPELDYPEQIRLYELEFKYAMDMVGAYNDFMKYTDLLVLEDVGMRFRVSAMRKKATALCTAEVISV